MSRRGARHHAATLTTVRDGAVRDTGGRCAAVAAGRVWVSFALAMHMSLAHGTLRLLYCSFTTTLLLPLLMRLPTTVAAAMLLLLY